MKILKCIVLTGICMSSLLTASVASAVEGLVEIKSPYSVQQTINRLEALVLKKGLKVFARIDHAAGAASVDMPLRPTELLIFGHPKGGTPLMLCAQTTGIDLPLKALAWQDSAGQIWLGHNDPRYLAQRHAASHCEAVEKLQQVLAAIMADVVASDVR